MLNVKPYALLLAYFIGSVSFANPSDYVFLPEGSYQKGDMVIVDLGQKAKLTEREQQLFGHKAYLLYGFNLRKRESLISKSENTVIEHEGRLYLATRVIESQRLFTDIQANFKQDADGYGRVYSPLIGATVRTDSIIDPSEHPEIVALLEAKNAENLAAEDRTFKRTVGAIACGALLIGYAVW